MSDREKTVKDDREPLGPGSHDPVSLNEMYGQLDRSVKDYVDSRFENLDLEFLKESALRGILHVREGEKANLSWRFDFYALLALLILSVLTWCVLSTLYSGSFVLINKDKAQESIQEETREESGRLGDEGPLSVPDFLIHYRADIYFVVVIVLIGIVFWRLRPNHLYSPQGQSEASAPVIVSEREPARLETSVAPRVSTGEVPLKWQKWLPFGRQRHLRRWRRLIRKYRERVVVLLKRLASTEEVNAEIRDSALNWAQVMEQGGYLGDDKDEKCLCVLFQFLYSLWIVEERQKDQRGRRVDQRGRREEFLRVGQTGSLPHLGIYLAKSRIDLKPNSKDPKVQIAVVEHAIWNLQWYR